MNRRKVEGMTVYDLSDMELSQEAFDSGLETLAADILFDQQSSESKLKTPIFTDIANDIRDGKSSKIRKISPDGVDQFEETVHPRIRKKVTSPPPISNNTRNRRPKCSKPQPSKSSVVNVIQQKRSSSSLSSKPHQKATRERKKPGRAACSHSKRKNEKLISGGYISADCLDSCRSKIKRCVHCFEWANYNNFYRHICEDTPTSIESTKPSAFKSSRCRK